jgi:hypothetical protein
MLDLPASKSNGKAEWWSLSKEISRQGCRFSPPPGSSAVEAPTLSGPFPLQRADPLPTPPHLLWAKVIDAVNGRA